jgi:hypothetical protein
MQPEKDTGPIHLPNDVPRPEELLERSPTANYQPAGYYSGFVTHANRPPFTLSTVSQMLTDPRIVYGLWLLKGPLLSNAHVKVNCDDEQIRQYGIKQINRFWMNSAARVLKAIEWGYSSSEVIFREVEGRVNFDTVKDFYPPDCRVEVIHGKPCGIRVRNVRGANGPVFLGFPKAMHHVHWRDRNPYFGLSRLYGAHIPWWETWSDGGFRDIRRLWFYKNSYEGGIIRHPPGSSRDEVGNLRNNRDLARELVDKKRTGGTLTLPNTLAGDQGQFAWLYEPPQANAAPEGLLEYGDILRDEELEALGIPPEIIASGGDQGFGSSTGRQVPQMAFYSILQELLQWLLIDFHDYVLNPLIRIVFGQGTPELELVPFRLSDDLSQQGGGGFDQQQGGFGQDDQAGGQSDMVNDQYNGNQFQDKNQRSVFMSHLYRASAFLPSKEAIHFRIGRRWFTASGGVINPMTTAI